MAKKEKPKVGNVYEIRWDIEDVPLKVKYLKTERGFYIFRMEKGTEIVCRPQSILIEGVPQNRGD